MKRNLQKMLMASAIMLTLLSGASMGNAATAGKIYGNVTWMDSWRWDTAPRGIYSITNDANPTMEAIAPSVNIFANGGAIYANGKYYVMHYTPNTDPLVGAYDCYDASTWKLLSTDSVTGNGNLAFSSAYDRTTSTAYSCTQNDGKTGFNLSKWDLTGNSKTVIAAFSQKMMVMAFDKAGQLYGIGADNNLYKINKQTAACTLVGSTGVSSYDLQSAVIDQFNNKFYWAAHLDNGSSGLYDVDMTTGAATQISSFPENAEFVGCYLWNDVNDKAPIAATITGLNFSQWNLNGTIAFTAPTLAADGSTLGGNMDYTIRANNDSISGGSVAAGANASKSITVKADGKYRFTLTMRNSAGTGIVADTTLWVGKDTPDSVTNVKLTKSGNNLNLAWNAPTTGANGGYINGDSITYTVTQYPENKVVASGIKATSFTDSYTSENYVLRYYGVKAKYAEYESSENKSNHLKLGASVALPYTETFTNQDDFDTYTVIDNNGDGNTWKWLNGGQAKYASDDTHKADDYLITPPFKASKDALYKVGYLPYNLMMTEKLAVKLGSSATVEAMTTTLMPATEITNDNAYKWMEREFTVPADGNYNIGFQACSDAQAWNLYIDSVRIEKEALLAAPDSVSNIHVTTDQDKPSVTLVFNLPTKTISGIAITTISKCEIYRNDTLINTMASQNAGAAVAYTDNAPAQKYNTYKVMAYNDSGNGRTATATAYIGEDLPLPPTNVVFVDSLNGTGVVTWKAPTKGFNGGKVVKENMKYYFVKTNGGDYVSDDLLTDTMYVDSKLPTGSTQSCIFYVVYATNNLGMSAYARSNFLMCGTPYATPFVETFAGATVVNGPWFTDIYANKGGWLTMAAGVNGETPEDGDGGMAMFQGIKNGASASLNSGKIDISKLAHPVADFWVNIPDEKATMKLSISADNKANEDLVSYAKTTGWQHYIVSLDKYKGISNIRLAFTGTASADSAFLYMDNLKVRNLYDNDLTITSLTGPASATVGIESSYSVAVKNNGTTSANGYKVQLYNNGTLLSVADGTVLDANSSKTFALAYTPVAADKDKTLNIYAKVDYAADEYTVDNISDTIQTATSGVTGIMAASQKVYATAGMIHVKGANGAEVTVYNVAGTEVYSTVGKQNLEIAEPEGIYMVKIGASTTKVVVR
ncbi:MAG: DUF6383 domain-containing protein [Muribaculaceae bacterium]|jgi:hypothetical protein|nr:DUF6383 domain-containing protein [Muribaculaceae bacterium]